jgi:hypothetical protein
VIALDDAELRKPRARYAAAADDLAAAITAGSLLAAAHVAALDSGSDALQVVRAEVRQEAITRRVLDSAGRVVSAAVLASLPGPWIPGAFDLAVYSVSKLLLTAWQARGGAR